MRAVFVTTLFAAAAVGRTAAQTEFTATGYDTRASECPPAGCLPELLQDGLYMDDDNSRWSCSTSSPYVDTGGAPCRLTITLPRPLLVNALGILWYRFGRTRYFKITADGNLFMEAESAETSSSELFGATTSSGQNDIPFYHPYEGYATLATVLEVEHVDVDPDDPWFSINELYVIAYGGGSEASSETSVSVTSTGYDTRSSENNGCGSNGCVPDNTRDNDILEDESRWSCTESITTGGVCSITYTFADRLYINTFFVSLYLGDERVRSLDVYVDGSSTPATSFVSSGDTDMLEIIDLGQEAGSIELRAVDLAAGEWISIKEVYFMADVDYSGSSSTGTIYYSSSYTTDDD